MPSREITCMQMSRLFRHMDGHYPVSDGYKAGLPTVLIDGRVRTEREHMIAWFRDNVTEGYGSYSRASGNTSARICYNRLQCPEAILWIAEAVGIDGDTVRRAAEAAMSIADHRGRCAAIRREIPWDAVRRKAGCLFGRYGIR